MTIQQYPGPKSGIPSGNTANRPSSPVIGDTYYNGQLEALEIFNGTAWVANNAPPTTPTIVSVTDTGGAIAFADGGTLTVVVAPGSGSPTPLKYNAVTNTGNFSSSSSTTTIVMSGLTPGAYTISANAANNFGVSVNTSPSSSVSATTVPQAPTIGTATLSGGLPVVNWTLNSNGGKALSAITITPYLNGTTAETSRTALTTSSTSYTFALGQLTEDASYTFKVTTTNANGTSLESAASNSVTQDATFAVNFLVVAGGAGGSGGAEVSDNRYGAGGGAGGLRSSISPTGGGGSPESAAQVALATNYTVTVGAGGGGGGVGGTGGQGNNSVFSSITSLGGGFGGKAGGSGAGNSGGCGGGGAGQTGGTGGAGTAGQGYAGGASAGSNSAGGGGGAGGVGTPGTSSGTAGAGVNNDLTGSGVGYSTGGYTTSGGGPAGTANTGNGGVGNYNAANGSAGGSGIVVLRYPDTRTITIGAGLSGSTGAASGGFKRTTITSGTGNVSWV